MVLRKCFCGYERTTCQSGTSQKAINATGNNDTVNKNFLIKLIF